MMKRPFCFSINEAVKPYSEEMITYEENYSWDTGGLFICALLW